MPDRWLIRICRVCGCALGETRAALALKVCPDCHAPTIPVEHATRAVRAVASSDDQATPDEPGRGGS